MILDLRVSLLSLPVARLYNSTPAQNVTIEKLYSYTLPKIVITKRLYSNTISKSVIIKRLYTYESQTYDNTSG